MEKKTIWDLDRPSVDQYRGRPKLPIVLIADNIRSLNNIGSLFRTSDAFLIDRIALCGISACPPSPEIHKTALGAEDSVAWSYYAQTIDAINSLRREGFVILCLEQVKGSVALDQFRPQPGQKYAVIVGHEVNGVSQEAVDAADLCLEIPQYGTKHSLNVAVSAALALWTLFAALK
ncbi:MAG: hypothetical protein NC342_01660 [Pseudoflavonifractor sp.]|nr:TrmH family RNA methyltransferase [Alloprevotella sp.]MCM1116230.1 hypothetical protein [Pseudoflavonifractor sp.]